MSKNKPMAAAKVKYESDGSIAWDKMWGSFCDLAIEGGPPHRGESSSISTNHINKDSDTSAPVVQELIRGLTLLTTRSIEVNSNGWISVELENINMAKWFEKIINTENVVASRDGKLLLLPCSDTFSIESEVKSVLTVFGKASHYWNEHRSIIDKVIISIFGYDPKINSRL